MLRKSRSRSRSRLRIVSSLLLFISKLQVYGTSVSVIYLFQEFEEGESVGSDAEGNGSLFDKLQTINEFCLSLLESKRLDIVDDCIYLKQRRGAYYFLTCWCDAYLKISLTWSKKLLKLVQLTPNNSNLALTRT